MLNVRRLGHATFETADLEGQLAYYTEVIGLAVRDRDQDRVFLTTHLGEEAITLRRGSTARLPQLAFQVAPGSDLGELAADLAKHGVKSERRRDVSPGVKDAIAFEDPKGTLLEVYSDYEFAPASTAKQGIMPLKLGHVASRVRDPQKLSAFYCDVLGFRVSDWIGDHFSFLRCGIDHHTINFARFDEERLHHIAFEVKNVPELHRACDALADAGIQLVWGPLRHIVGHNVAAYHRNSDDHRVELFCELDIMRDESLGYFEPRPWHQDRPQRPKVWPKDTWRSQWGFGSFGTFPGYP
jgi:catechol-2,3-dioxygenase